MRKYSKDIETTKEDLALLREVEEKINLLATSHSVRPGNTTHYNLHTMCYKLHLAFYTLHT